ncbi:hypothetical protein [Microbacterium sp. MTN4-26]|uniref:hypothetical protein n=1 Tax=unclassified Microbacterium TaxID=2609290 RepID=UPI0036F3ACE6
MTANETPRGNGALEDLAGGLISPKDTTDHRHDHRAAPMALDTGTSSAAAAKASRNTIGAVKAGIIEILSEHPATDEEISTRYNVRVGHPRFPKVTDQRLRTARAALVREGTVRDSGALAFTSLGNRCTLWEAS